MEDNIYTKTHDTKTSSEEYSYFLSNYFEFFHSSFTVETTIEKNEIGELFATILNSRHYYYEFFEEYLSKIENTKEFVEIENIRKEIIEQSYSELDSRNNAFFLIINEVDKIISQVDREYTSQSVQEKIDFIKKMLEKDKYLLKERTKGLELLNDCVGIMMTIEDLKFNIEYKKKEIKSLSKDINIIKKEKIISQIKTIYDEIKSTLEVFNNYLIEKDNKKKKEMELYLLWGNVIPKTFNRMLNGKFLAYSLEYSFYKEKDLLKKLEPIKEYRITTMRELIYILVDLYFNNRYRINICDNCGKFFVVNVRGDKKYCDYIYKNGLKCSEYAPKYKFNNKEITKKYNKLVNRYRSKINNNKNKDKIEIHELTKELNEFKDTFTNNKELVKKQKMSEKNFQKWIDKEIIEYEKKYFKK